MYVSRLVVELHIWATYLSLHILIYRCWLSLIVCCSSNQKDIYCYPSVISSNSRLTSNLISGQVNHHSKTFIHTVFTGESSVYLERQNVQLFIIFYLSLDMLRLFLYLIKIFIFSIIILCLNIRTYQSLNQILIKRILDASYPIEFFGN